jgi:predicted DNA-binding ribbon-helix-helix protein
MAKESVASLGTLIDATQTKLRLLQRAGTKTAVRLENIYWSQLQDFAREDKTTVSRLVLQQLDQHPNVANRTSLLRCYCLDRLRRKPAGSALVGQSFDLLALVSACPTPVAIITSERKLVAFNPSFSNLIRDMRSGDKGAQRAIQLSFSEPMPRILQHLNAAPNDIKSYHLGLQLGEGKARYFNARFALADRSRGNDSLIAIYLDVTVAAQPQPLQLA